jgi:hypothetical protein
MEESKMRASCRCECNFCKAEKVYKSEWLPAEVLTVFMEVWFFFHVLKHHREYANFKRVGLLIKQIFSAAIVVVLLGVLIILRIVFYPLWLLLNELYK